ncbi:phasin family protein [Noviherbaspirillum aridicola]|uniref:Phasin family protein n=1 Tax=Noviherbaspirillum aridicola TaxID=2849687 RepID=A0ABQ4Q0Q1_9BURK|nr:phasin family protein [Noviherbaspirillum aridicola]GIZ50616.1 phasin family protein [Noviherbaspirillum aridicola]
MFTTNEQFSNASKASIEANLALLSSLSTKAFDGFEKLFDLNLNAFKSSLDDSTSAAKQLLAARDPQEFLTLAAAQAQPNMEKAIAYSRHLTTIASGVQAEISKAAEAQIAEASRKVLELVEELSKNAPAGSENAVAMLKSAIGNASAGYEQFSKSTKQAVEVMETNLNNAVSQFTPPAAKAAKAAKK